MSDDGMLPHPHPPQPLQSKTELQWTQCGARTVHALHAGRPPALVSYDLDCWVVGDVSAGGMQCLAHVGPPVLCLAV